MRAWLGFVLAALLSGGTAADARAQERILDYHADIRVLADGGLEVAERISVRAEGRRIRRGIYRDFPTRYRDRFGNRVVVDFQVIEVLRGGRPEAWFTEKLTNGVRVNTGGDAFLPVPGEFEFTIRYRTDRQLGFFENHDELYWNVTGTGWEFAIDRAGARVELPGPVAAEALQTDYYTGAQGARNRNARARIPTDGVFEFETTRPLPPGHGLTIVAGWPKGLVAEPTRSERLGWFLKDNRGVLVALAGLGAVLAFYLRHWRLKGRDPAPGMIIPRYEPPEGYSPAGLRYLRRQAHDTGCLVADLVDMAVAGHLKIRREAGGRSGRWFLERSTGDRASDLLPSQVPLYRALFDGRDEVELKPGNAPILQKASLAQLGTLKERYQPRYFITNAGTVAAGFILTLAVFGLAVYVSGGAGMLAIIAVGVVLLALNVLFGWLMKAPTDHGRRLLDHIEGLRDYMETAEKPDLARLEHRNPNEPSLDAPRFERLLPHAMALDVEDAWTKKFEAAVGHAAAEAAARRIGWYHGSGARLSSMGDLGRTLGSGFSSQVRSAASPPGSGSGMGGGSSGGGGGGGGGGGR